MAKKAAKAGKSDLTPEEQRRLFEAFARKKEVEFVFELEGDLRDMSVFELAPTLQSMGVALREANRTLFPQSTDLRVGVKPIE